MLLHSQQRRLVVMVSRKRERWPSSEGEESPLLTPLTPPAADKKRSFDEDDEELWGVEMPEWGDGCPSEIQKPNKRSRDRLWWAHDDSLLLVHRDPIDSSNFPEYFSSHVPFAMSAADLSAEELYSIGERSRLLTLSREDCLEDIANTATPVTPSPVVSRAADDEPAVIQQPPRVRDVQSGKSEGESEDEGSSNLPDKLSVGEKNVGSSP